MRRRVLDSGPFVEPAWTGSPQDGVAGPVVFVSRLLAHIYAYLRNEYHSDDDSGHWKAILLQDFDLFDHAKGIGGPLCCMMVFGFSMETETDVVCVRAPRVRYVPLPFNIPEGAEGVTFSFNQWAFDFMRDEWKALGLRHYEGELEAVDELDDGGFDRLYQTAVAQLGVCREPSGRCSARRTTHGLQVMRMKCHQRQRTGCIDDIPVGGIRNFVCQAGWESDSNIESFEVKQRELSHGADVSGISCTAAG